MARSHYNWQRFWILRGNSVYLSANGYLSGERRYLNPHIINMTPLGAPAGHLQIEVDDAHL